MIESGVVSGPQRPLSDPHRRVLMLAYYFPPLGGGGVQRTLKYVKYLPSEGFDSIVITDGRRGFFLRDETLDREVPDGTLVLRAPALPLQQAQWKLDGLLRRARVPTTLAANILWPDGLVGWLVGAVWRALRAVRTHRPDVLYSTSSPTTAHLAALIVHRLTGLPWVADFRDPWALATGDPEGPSGSAVARANAALERKVVEEASYVTVADDTIHLAGLHLHDPRRVVLPNGVDPEDVPLQSAPGPRPDLQRFRLSHVGSLYGHRDGAPVFAAIRDLIDRGKLHERAFELRIIGHARLTDDVELDSLPLTFTGYVHHSRAIAEMASSSALLLYQPNGYPTSSGKIYEYLASGRPVLCVASRENPSYRLVEHLRAGECAEPQDQAAIASAIERLVTKWQSGANKVHSNVRQEVLRRFSRRKLTGELAAVLRTAIARDRTNTRQLPRPA